MYIYLQSIFFFFHFSRRNKGNILYIMSYLYILQELIFFCEYTPQKIIRQSFQLKMYNRQQKQVTATNSSLSINFSSSKSYSSHNSFWNACRQLTESEVQGVLKKHLSYENSVDWFNKNRSISNQEIKLKKPPLGQSNFTNTWPFVFRLRKIMIRAYNYQQIKLSEFEQFQDFFKLNSNQLKEINYPDPIILQALRFAIYNKQQIPSPLAKVIVQMAKTNMIKEWEIGYYIICKAIAQDVLSLGFEPPLDLYLEFIDTGLIKPNEDELNQVFTRNQYFYKSVYNKKQFYPKISHKKMLIFNQFPYLLDIFDKIIRIDPEEANYGIFQLYLSSLLNFLYMSHEDQLFQRYLPQVKCRYLKIKPQLTDSDFQYLFLCLKNISDISIEDFKMMYHTKPGKTLDLNEHEVKSFTQFGKIEEICEKILTIKDFHLTKQQFQSMSDFLNFEKYLSVDIIKLNLVFVIFREQAYRDQQFPKNLIKNILWILKMLPDKKKKKQSCYILLHQFFKFLDKSKQKAEIQKEYNLSQYEFDSILDEGRLIAFDILINQQDKKLILEENKFEKYHNIVKKVMDESKNQKVKVKAGELYKKMNKVRSFPSEDLKYYEQNIGKNNSFIQFLGSETKNNGLISVNCIKDIIKILIQNNNSQIKSSCLSTLGNVVKNLSHGQKFPKKFEETVIQMIINLQFYAYLPEECKNEALKLLIDCTYLPGTYALIEPLIHFLYEIYLKSPINNILHINSSFCIYLIASNFREHCHTQYQINCQFLDKFIKIQSTQKQEFSSKSKGNINILCAIAVLAKNYILSPQLVEMLTLAALKNKNIADIVLTAVFYYVKYAKTLQDLQKPLLNVCQILKNSDNDEIIGVYILQNGLQLLQTFPNSLKNKICELTKHKKCESEACKRLCSFYKNKVRRI